MTDFQFDPGATNDPEENLHPYTMKPQTHGALDIHVLQISGQPMPAGATMPVPKGPELFTYTPKPTLHAEEPQSLPEHPLSMKAKTATGGSVWYDYSHNKAPLSATVYDETGAFESYHKPSEIAFPALKTPVKGPPYQLDVEITKLLGPEKPTLHVGELTPTPETSPSVPAFKAKTPSGGSVYYYYNKDWTPDSADIYEKASYVKTHNADEINFPLHPSLEQKPFEPGEASKPSLAKVNLPENYPKEEQIDGLYNKPVYSKTPPNYPALNLKEPLTEEEYKVAHEYSGTYYQNLANHIYHEGTSYVEKQDIETLTKAIDKHPLQSDMTLYRGVNEGVFNKFALLRPGQSGWQTGFMSTRTDRPGAENWKGSKYHFVIETPAGTPALPMETLSKNAGENEVLFKPNTKLQMVKREVRTLYLKVVQPASNEQGLKYYSAHRTRDYTKDEFPWEYREYTEYAKKRFPDAFASENDFREKYVEAPLVHLPEDTLRNLENSTVGSYFHAGMEKARNDFSHHRDVDRIEGQMIAGSMPPPIVLKYSGGYRVLGGNTRLSVGAARGYNIPVKLIDISDKY